jgi:hypothetical protein
MRLRLLHRAPALFALLAMLALAPAAARAQTGGNKVAAEALFEEGRRLMAEGKAAEACPKFADSQKLDPSPGTLLNLANCYEKSDRPATAWATYREGASAASALNRQDLVATAQRHADALYGGLPRVSVTVSAPVEGLTVKLDGVEVGKASWGLALPVDPGEHALEASAPRFLGWSSKLTIGKEATTTPVAVPALEPAPAAVAASGTAEVTSEGATPLPASEGAPEAPVDGSRGRAQRTAGLLVGAGGVVALGIGAAAAAVAKSKYNSSLADCSPTAPDRCTQAGVDERGGARTAGDVASVAIGVGAAALAGGVLLWLTAPSPGGAPPRAASIRITPTLGGAMVSGRW